MNPHNHEKPHVLLIDPDRAFAHVVRIVAQPMGIHLTWIASGHKALSELESQRYDAVLVDHGLPDINGISLLFEIRRRRGFPERMDDCVLIASDPEAAEPWATFAGTRIAGKGSTSQLAQLLTQVTQPGHRRGAVRGTAASWSRPTPWLGGRTPSFSLAS